MLKKYWLTVLIGVFTGFNIIGQNSFSATPTNVRADKPADIFVFYNFTQLENHTNDSLQLRWVKKEVITSSTSGQSIVFPAAWKTGIQDPLNFYNPGEGVDSADFVIPPNTSSLDKLILQLFPNGEAGRLRVRFDIFRIDDPTDRIEVSFDYSAKEVLTEVSAVETTPLISFSPNPSQGLLYLSNHTEAVQMIKLINHQGQVLREIKLMGRQSQQRIDWSHLPKGLYYLYSNSGETTYLEKVLIQ